MGPTYAQGSAGSWFLLGVTCFAETRPIRVLGKGHVPMQSLQRELRSLLCNAPWAPPALAPLLPS